MVTAELPELALRSLDATWDYACWERRPDDGNGYEVIAELRAAAAYDGASSTRSCACMRAVSNEPYVRVPCTHYKSYL